MSEPHLTVACYGGLWIAAFHLPNVYVRAEGRSEGEVRAKATSLYVRLAASERADTLPPPGQDFPELPLLIEIFEEHAEGKNRFQDPNDEAEPSRGDGAIVLTSEGGRA